MVIVMVAGWMFAGTRKKTDVAKETADPESAAALLVIKADEDIQAKRWNDAIAKASKILSNPGVSSKLRDAAQAEKKLAEQESKSKGTYDRFASAAGSSNYDKALEAYADIPSNSVYRQIAREQYDQIFPLFVENHLKAAEEARGQGRCSDVQAHAQAILTLEPKHTKSLAMRDRPCKKGGGGSDSSEITAAASSTKPERSKEPRHKLPDAGDKLEALKAPQRAPAVESPGDVDTRLSEAQTEYVNGNYQKAIDIAKSVQSAPPEDRVRVWRIIGSAACNIKDLKLVNDAYRRLNAPGRQYLVYVCQRNGIQNSGSQFKLAEP